jgi:hypothetical protein
MDPELRGVEERVERELLLERGYGVLSQISSAVTVAFYDRASESARLVSEVRRLRRHGVHQQVLTREQERRVLASESGVPPPLQSNKRTTLLLSADGDNAAGCRALRALLETWDAGQRCREAPPAVLPGRLAVTVLLTAVDLTSRGLTVVRYLREHGGDELFRLTDTQTRVGNCPSFHVRTDCGSQVVVTLYMPSGKLKLQAGICLQRREVNCVVGRTLQLLHAAAPDGPRLRSFCFRDNVNFNRREELYGVHSVDYLRHRFALAGGLLHVIEPPEQNGAARLEVTATLPGSRREVYGGSINVFATGAETDRSALARSWLPGSTAPPPQRWTALALRINLTGRVTPKTALDQTDAVALAARADENLVAHPLFAEAVRRVLHRRGAAQCDALNRRRDRVRILRSLERIEAQLASTDGAPRPLSEVFEAPTYGAGPASARPDCRFCFMCQSAYELGKSGRRAVQCCCQGAPPEARCIMRSVSLETRPTPTGADFRTYSDWDGPLALTLASLCDPGFDAGGGALGVCCTSCFQHNNRRRRAVEADDWIHANSRYILRLLFTGPVPLRKRNEKKLIKSCVRILTQTLALPDGSVVFLCPPLFRPLLEVLALRWRLAPDALPGRGRGAPQPLRGRHATWTPEAVCLFRRWIARCNGQHWTDAGLWVWRQGFYRRRLGDPEALRAPLDAIGRAGEALLGAPEPGTYLDVLEGCGLAALFQQANRAFQAAHARSEPSRALGPPRPAGAAPALDAAAAAVVARGVALVLARAAAPAAALSRRLVTQPRGRSLAAAVFGSDATGWRAPCEDALRQLRERPAADWARLECDFVELAQLLLQALRASGVPPDSDAALAALAYARDLVRELRAGSLDSAGARQTLGYLAILAVRQHRGAPRRRRQRLPSAINKLQ